jgi:hypothetical protein
MPVFEQGIPSLQLIQLSALAKAPFAPGRTFSQGFQLFARRHAAMSIARNYRASRLAPKALQPSVESSVLISGLLMREAYR